MTVKSAVLELGGPEHRGWAVSVVGERLYWGVVTSIGALTEHEYRLESAIS